MTKEQRKKYFGTGMRSTYSFGEFTTSEGDLRSLLSLERKNGTGPKYIRDDGVFLYKEEDVFEWLKSRGTNWEKKEERPSERAEEQRKVISKIHHSQLSEVRGENLKLKQEIKELRLKLDKLSDESDEFGLMSLGEILALSRVTESYCGIYFLIKNHKIVYVGQSVSIYSRISQHLIGGKDFDRFAFIDTPRESLLDVEALYIRKFNPPLNGVKPTRVAMMAEYAMK